MSMSLAALPAVQEFANNAGMKSDMLIMVVMLFLPLFLAPFYFGLNSAFARSNFDIVVGSLILFALYGEYCIHFYALSLVCVILIYATGKHAPKIVWVVAFGYLGARHVIRYMLIDAGSSYDVDITGPMMMLVLKVISLAYEFSREFSAPADKRKYKGALTLQALSGYLLHHSTLIVGPVIRLDEYLEYVSVQKQDLPNGGNTRWVPALTKLVVGLFFFGLYVKFSLLDSSSMRDLLNEEFAYSLTFFGRVWYFYFETMKLRFKFYAAWSVTESALILAGWGYDRKLNTWSRVANVHPIAVEFGENARSTINNWNISVSEWLREYVMEKAPFSKNVNTLASFVVSAVWHGFSLNQYTFFVLVGVYLLVIARNCRSAFQPIAVRAFGGRLKWLYDIVGTVTHLLTMNFLSPAWAMETLTETWIVWRCLNFYGVFFAVIAFVASKAVLVSFPEKDKKKKQ